jgi:DNA-binding NarL/FixJ family response regulator
VKGDAEAIDAMRDALRQAEQRDTYGEASSILSALVLVLPQGDPRWLEIFDAMCWGAERVFRGSVEARMAVNALRNIDLVLADSADPGRRAAVKFRLASFLTWGLGDLQEGEATCRQAVELFQQAGDEPMLRLAANELAYIRGLSGDLEGQEEQAAEVAEAAERSGERFTTMQALGALGTAAIFHGRFDKAEMAMRRSVEIAEQSGKPHHTTFSLSLLACSLALEGRIQEAFPLLAQAKAGNPAYSESMFLESETLINWLAGDYTGAGRSAAEAVAQRPTGMSRRRAWAMAFAAVAALERGALKEARAHVDRARAAYEERGWLFFTDLCTWAQGNLAWREEKRSEALKLLAESAERTIDMAVWPWAGIVLADLAEYAAETGDVHTARSAAGRLADVARNVGADVYHALAAIGAGWSSLAQGDHAQAGRSAEQAVPILRQSGWKAYLGRAIDLWGQALAGPDRSRAVELTKEAAEAFRACGAEVRLQRSLDRLRDLGSRGRRAAAAALGPDALTRREREVARLAAEGRTHREIGELLFIGERTVETHLANAYAKLGLESKLDLIRRIGELKL